MKKIVYVILTIVVMVSAGFFAYAAQDGSEGKVTAYYFHGTFRCTTCNKMEKYSREAIEANFKDALKASKLEFRAVNIEERVNEHFVNEYQLYTQSLVLSFVKAGKEVKHKNLDKIWEFVKDKQKFVDYVTLEINEFMKEMK